MSTSKNRPRKPYLDPMERARRLSNYIRLLAFVVAATILMAGVGLQLYPSHYLLGVAGLLGYPLLVQTLVVVGQRKDLLPEHFSPVVMQLDAAIIGVACALLVAEVSRSMIRATRHSQP